MDLVNLLKKKNSATFVTIVTETDPTMRKTDNPYVGVKKVMSNNGIICFSYEKAVNKERDKEGVPTTFTPSPRKWGMRLTGTPLVENKGKYYLEFRFIRAAKPSYYLDGKEIPYDNLKPFMPEKSSNADHQGVDPEKEIIIRDFSIDSIKLIKMDNEEYMVA